MFISKNIAKETSGTTISLAEVSDIAIAKNVEDTAGNMILKFDIEGAEWEMFAGCNVQLLKRFRIITGEIHGLSRLLDVNFYLSVRMVMDKLCLHHQVPHVHANNIGRMGVREGVLVPDLIEISFLRRDFGPFEATCERFPGPLDYPNQPDKSDIVLNF